MSHRLIGVVLSICRSDGGRYSMRVTTTNKLKTSPSSSASSSKRTTPVKGPLLSKAEREKESEREREKAAWDRRRSYDPRRAVKEVKLVVSY